MSSKITIKRVGEVEEITIQQELKAVNLECRWVLINHDSQKILLKDNTLMKVVAVDMATMRKTDPLFVRDRERHYSKDSDTVCDGSGGFKFEPELEPMWAYMGVTHIA